MTNEEPPKRAPGLLGLPLDAFDAPPVVRVGTTLVRVAWIHMQEGRAVIELETDDMAVAAEQLVLDSVTAAKARAARSEAGQPART
ncbi:hypothetical protein [Actinoplanes teichomyceticus]|uniref:Uncharacterized protein n=1 Tax=Actinoplanes teichomyceticus TaxID=1867 RepID=A0A561VQ79_ACTTI|nr:hypothetical protein [Actinoplanes teichomyceticus]TWG13722.1 hypothetical protein FHX34_1049 [Actinoplanes teichomyceticus]GIF12453.1 hypothetical protein Ate01nite_24850 [Actinoplanes teichomyceticus]